MVKVNIQRLNIVLTPSQERVLIRPLIPSEGRCYRIISRVMFLSEEEVSIQLSKMLKEFKNRHQNIVKILLQHYDLIKQWTITDVPLTENRKILIGAYFTQEYSLESSALFNPSIVLHPDQSNLPEDSIRFIISLRATGEGHISSIVFREGIINKDYQIDLVPPTAFVIEPDKTLNQFYEKKLFTKKLFELGLDNKFSRLVLKELNKDFSFHELHTEIDSVIKNLSNANDILHTKDGIMTLAYSNYEVIFDSKQRTSEKAIFPSSPSQKNGIEDARFVQFKDDDLSTKYYATYTAFDGETIFPQLIETDDFIKFQFSTLNGSAVTNKGMALFPKKINGKYVMISRQDNENIYIMFSDNIHFWHSPQIILRPTYYWEYVQLGNCGSPIETDSGWLVLSHGVGPMRKYCIGAFLLDKDDPTKIIGRLKEPLIEPNENEREGYVPNVVYTCGAIKIKNKLIIPYAMSDYATAFAIADIDEIINTMI